MAVSSNSEEVPSRDNDRFPSENHGRKLCALLTHTGRSHSAIAAEGVIVAVAAGAIVPLFAYLLGDIFNEFAKFGGRLITAEDFKRTVVTKVSYVAILGAVACVLNGLLLLAWMLFGDMHAWAARMKLFSSVINRPITWYDSHASGVSAALEMAQNHVRELQLAVSQPTGFLIQSAVTCVAALGLAFWKSWDLTLVCLSTVPLCLIALAFVSGKMQPAIDEHAEKLTQCTRQIKSIVEAIEVVKSCNAQFIESCKYLDTIESAAQAYLKQAWWNATQISFVRFLTKALFVQGFWYGSHLVQGSHKSAGQVLTAFWGCLMATQTVEQILPQLFVLERGRAAARSLDKFIGSGDIAEIDSQTPGFTPKVCEGGIEFLNVKFAYPAQPSEWRLLNVSMKFAAGRTTFVIGKSGSGKSTLIALLLRFYSGWNGQITLDGNPIDLLHLRWLREKITVVSQDSVLFEETVLKNIAFGKGGSDTIRRSVLHESIQLAVLSEVLDVLPKGLETLLGPGGTRLSGGQAQRVAIARARVKDSPVLILDEATSALDQATARSVIDNILAWRRGKTTIVITHSMAQVRPDDFAYVLDNGRVVQKGIRQDMEHANATNPFVNLVNASNRSSIPMSRLQESRHNAFGEGAYLKSRPVAKRDGLLPDPLGEPSAAANAHLPGEANGQGSLRLKKSSLALLRQAGSGLAMPRLSMPASRLSTVRHSVAIPQLLEPKHETLSNVAESRSSVVDLPLGQTARYRGRKNSWMEEERESTVVELEEMGGREMSISHPLRASEGSMLESVGVPTPSPPLSLARILTTVWPRLRLRFRIYCCLGLAGASIHAACTPIFSWVFARLLATYYNPEGAPTKAMQLSLSLLGIGFADALASFFMHYLLECSAQAWVDDMRFDAMRRVLDQPRLWFEQGQHRALDISEQLNRAAEELKPILGRFTGQIFVAMMMMAVGLTWCLLISWKLTLVGVSAAPILYALTTSFDRVSTKWETKLGRACQVASNVMSEMCSKITTVRAFSLEEYFSKKHELAVNDAMRLSVKRGVVSSIFFGISDGGIFFVTALTFWYGSVLVSGAATAAAAEGGEVRKGTGDETSVTDVLTVFSMLLFVVSGVNAIISFIPQVGSARSTAAKLLALTQLSSLDNEEYTGDTRVSTLTGPIRFRNVRFRYPSRPDLMVLNGVSFEITKESSTALVGPSGSGKSTIVGLLLRIYSLTKGRGEGSLKLGDIPLSQLDSSSWRSLLAYVPQQANVFPGTFAENIAYGLSTRSPYRQQRLIRNAAVHAGIDGFISSLPEGYETMVGEGGMGLSGGQRQKLAIARALIRRPKLLILDEPTSALDASSAKAMRSLLRNLVEVDRMTVLVVTHSVEMMRAMQKVVVIDQGRVVEQGKFDELKAGSGALNKLLGTG